MTEDEREEQQMIDLARAITELCTGFPRRYCMVAMAAMLAGQFSDIPDGEFVLMMDEFKRVTLQMYREQKEEACEGQSV